MLDERRIPPAVAAFYETNGRWPSVVTDSDYERSLGQWLNRQRVALASKTMDDFRRAALDQAIPGWEADPDSIWLDRAREASDFLLTHRLIPSVQSSRYNERMIALWLTGQQSLLRAGRLRGDRRRWLEEHCPGWSRTPPRTLTKKTAGPVGIRNA
ncbi:helicase associated domain-containing protein [Arthrobacter sp. zg-Y1110]|uniref:helicase associated domain-containing protein n=1 Tax=Arthrobacter sp. zg-Y1110 TaxID=2886932 RepID=UPI001D158099|nr:helicase associated domain-containing protein [Arthrobacter sp. zg-Y1110]MCC3292841.1 helicase associated domain-containing protein [Arthrobacter sp. zg-Y1110]UWX86780.1 helicase associated domain-containing protein [Arthrobacter sp. zg-Y1110]